MSENKIYLQDITTKIGSGATPKGGNESYHESGISLIRSQNILDFTFSKKGLVFLDRNQAKLLSNVEVYEDDILLNITGDSIARCCIVPREILPARVNQHVSIIRAKADIDSKYLLYYLQNLKPYLLNISRVGGTRNALTKDAISKLPITLVKNHKKIASLLSSLDEKVELNNRINSELELIVQTIYDYWFVQFEFPNEDGEPYKSSGGKMVYNEELKREIPEGWEVGTLNNWISNDKTGDWGKEEEEGNYTLKVSCIRGADINGLNGRGEVNAPKRFILEKNVFKILDTNDVIIEISGGSPTQSTGRMAYVTESMLERFENPIICSNFCKAISLKDPRYIHVFAFLWNKLYDNNIFFGFEGKTSGIKNFLFDSFVTSYSVIKPNIEIVKQFNVIVDNIKSKIQKSLKENQELTSLRDWLLPMLMNEQVGFKEESKVDIVENRNAGLKSAVLAGHIINQNLNNDFGRVKLMKLLYLSEQICDLNFDSNYLRETAGPYDCNLISNAEDLLKRYFIFSSSKQYTKKGNDIVKYTPLAGASQIASMFKNQFGDKAKNIESLLTKLNKLPWHTCEIIATLYAVWNNRIIRNLTISDNLLLDDFYEWSTNKQKYTKEDITNALEYMRAENIIPVGRGKYIE